MLCNGIHLVDGRRRLRGVLRHDELQRGRDVGSNITGDDQLFRGVRRH